MFFPVLKLAATLAMYSLALDCSSKRIPSNSVVHLEGDLLVAISKIESKRSASVLSIALIKGVLTVPTCFCLQFFRTFLICHLLLLIVLTNV